MCPQHTVTAAVSVKSQFGVSTTHSDSSRECQESVRCVHYTQWQQPWVSRVRLMCPQHTVTVAVSVKSQFGVSTTHSDSSRECQKSVRCVLYTQWQQPWVSEEPVRCVHYIQWQQPWVSRVSLVCSQHTVTAAVSVKSQTGVSTTHSDSSRECQESVCCVYYTQGVSPTQWQQPRVSGVSLVCPLHTVTAVVSVKSQSGVYTTHRVCPLHTVTAAVSVKSQSGVYTTHRVCPLHTVTAAVSVKSQSDVSTTPSDSSRECQKSQSGVSTTHSDSSRECQESVWCVHNTQWQQPWMSRVSLVCPQHTVTAAVSVKSQSNVFTTHSDSSRECQESV